ncbi:hypothetical protein OQA88_6451 [Cercophora sp. LCS_1]
MADDSLDSGLLAIALSDSESEPENGTSTPAEGAGATRADRTALSEAAFQQLKATYRAKVENGEVWSHSTIHQVYRLSTSDGEYLHESVLQISSAVTLPLGPSVSKPDLQTLLHAVEELYFFRRYDQGVRFVQAIFSDEGCGELYLDDDMKRLLRHYEARCAARLQNGSPSPLGSKV